MGVAPSVPTCPKRWRIGLWFDDPVFFTSQSYQLVLADLRQRLRTSDIELEEVRPIPLIDPVLLCAKLMAAEATGSMSDESYDSYCALVDDLDPLSITGAFAAGTAMDHRSWLLAEQERLCLAAMIEAELSPLRRCAVSRQPGRRSGPCR